MQYIHNGLHYRFLQDAYYYGEYEYSPGFRATCYAARAQEIESGRDCTVFWRIAHPDAPEEEGVCDWPRIDYVAYD